MPYTSLDKILSIGTAAERAAFTPDPPAGVASIWHESDTGNHYAWSGSAWVQVNGSGGGGGGAYEVANWSALLALTGVPDGRTYRVLAPLCVGGVRGTAWTWTGARWAPAHGQILASTEVAIDGTATAVEQFLWQPLFPAGVFSGARRIRLRAKINFSATDAAARAFRWRMGASGDASDAQVIFVANNSSMRQSTLPAILAPVSDTALRIDTINSGTALSPDVQNNTTSASTADIAVPSLSATGLYVSVSVTPGAAPTAFPTLHLASIYVE